MSLKPFGPSIIRCLECEGRTHMDGITKIRTGHGKRDAVRCVCVNCKVVWGIYTVDLPNKKKVDTPDEISYTLKRNLFIRNFK